MYISPAEATIESNLSFCQITQVNQDSAAESIADSDFSVNKEVLADDDDPDDADRDKDPQITPAGAALNAHTTTLKNTDHQTEDTVAELTANKKIGFVHEISERGPPLNPINKMEN